MQVFLRQSHQNKTQFAGETLLSKDRRREDRALHDNPKNKQRAAREQLGSNLCRAVARGEHVQDLDDHL